MDKDQMADLLAPIGDLGMQMASMEVDDATADAALREVLSGAAEAGAEAGAAEVGPEVDAGGDVGEELLELPTLPRLEAKAGEMLLGIALRLVREPATETPWLGSGSGLGAYLT